MSRYSQLREKGALGKGNSMTRGKMLNVYMGDIYSIRKQN